MQNNKRQNRCSAFKQQQQKKYSSLLHAFFFLSTLHIVGKFHKKGNILSKKLRKTPFCQRLHPDWIQNDEQNIDGVNRVHQHP